MVKINGEIFDIAGTTIAEYLSEAKYNIDRIAVEKNGEIVPKGMYATERLSEGDSLEIVRFVGGG